MKSWPVRLALTLSLATLAGCVSFDDGGAATMEPATIERGELGSARNVTTLGDLTMAGQPSPEDLALAKKRGITRVINIRTTPELERLGWDEAARCAELGLEYVGVAFRGDQATDATYDTLLELLELPAPDGGGTLFHCASGNRTALIIALHRMRTQGVSFEEALADAQAAGMKPDSQGPLEVQAERLGLR